MAKETPVQYEETGHQRRRSWLAARLKKGHDVGIGGPIFDRDRTAETIGAVDRAEIKVDALRAFGGLGRDFDIVVVAPGFDLRTLFRIQIQYRNCSLVPTLSTK